MRTLSERNQSIIARDSHLDPDNYLGDEDCDGCCRNCPGADDCDGNQGQPTAMPVKTRDRGDIVLISVAVTVLILWGWIFYEAGRWSGLAEAHRVRREALRAQDIRLK